MSTGGNVPSQGAVVQEATSAKKRGDRSMGHPNGYVGKGTAGRNLKRRHRRDMKVTKQRISLCEYAKRLASEKPDPRLERQVEDVGFATTWLERKGLL
jgi:hypothetical protein